MFTTLKEVTQLSGFGSNQDKELERSMHVTLATPPYWQGPMQQLT